MEAQAEKVSHCLALLLRACRVVILASTDFVESATGLKDALEARRCQVVAGFETTAGSNGSCDDKEHSTSDGRPSKKARLVQANKPVDAVIVLGSAPTSMKNWNPKSRPGPLQLAATAAMHAIAERVPVYTFVDEAAEEAPNVFAGGCSLVHDLVSRLKLSSKSADDPNEVASRRWEEAVAAIEGGMMNKLSCLLETCPEMRAARDHSGKTLLHVAAARGSRPAVQVLLEAGASWKAQDLRMRTAGEEALASMNQVIFDDLVIHASGANRSERSGEEASPNPKRHTRDRDDEYLNQKLCYQQGRLLDANGRGVMMGWEAPLMAKHAEAMRPQGADVLNVGFGLGLIDGYLEELRPKSHAIIEAHPDVLAEIERQGWNSKSHVTVHRGQWQDVVAKLPAACFDAIFYDTWDETYVDLHAFFRCLPRLLRPGGRVSFFNGAAPYNIFFHAVYSRMAQEDLMDLGFTCHMAALEIGSLGDETWKDVAQRYWSFHTYYLPVATLAESSRALQEAEYCIPRSIEQIKGLDWRPWPTIPVCVNDVVGDGIDLESEYWGSPSASEESGDEETDKDLVAIFDECIGE